MRVAVIYYNQIFAKKRDIFEAEKNAHIFNEKGIVKIKQQTHTHTHYTQTHILKSGGSPIQFCGNAFGISSLQKKRLSSGNLFDGI